MSEDRRSGAPLAYLDGRFLPAAEFSLPVTDAGFVQGAAVAEQIRTFRGQMFRLDEHLERLRHSLDIIGVAPDLNLADLAKAATELAAHNHQLLADGDDLGLSLFVTPGDYPTFVQLRKPLPRVAMHTYPLPFHLWADKYEQGQKLTITDVVQVPAGCWPAELKCRSRIHYYLADRKAALAEPGARALLLDQQGHVVESSTANVVLFRSTEGFLSPPRENILPGVSLAVLEELARGMGLAMIYRDLTPEDVLSADEVMLTSTSPCLVPVVSLNREPVAGGAPGPMFRRTMAAWSKLVGLDIAQQARNFCRRESG